MWLHATAALTIITLNVEDGIENLRFEVRGSAVIKDSQTDTLSPVEVEWQRTPTSSDFTNLDRKDIVHEATIQADCQPAAGGRLKDCKVMDELPQVPNLAPIYQKAFDLLVMTPSSAKVAHDARVIFISLRMLNPGGTNEDQNYCGPPFCTSTPPPPPPLPAERG